MYTKKSHFFLSALLIMSGFLSFACATDQGATTEKKPYAEMTKKERSQREWEDRVLESSYYEGSGYIRQLDDEGGTDVGEWMRTRKELEAKQQESEKRLAQLEQETMSKGAAGSQSQTAGSHLPVAAAATATTSHHSSDSEGILRFKVAMVVLPQVYSSTQDSEEHLSAVAVDQFAKNQRLFLVDPVESKEILTQQGLAVGRDSEAAIARALSIYPAARLVVFIDTLTLDQKNGGRMSYTVVDGFSGRTVQQRQETVSTAQSSPGRDKLLRPLLAKLAADLERRSGKYGWSSRVATVEGNRIYLSAGKASGLKKGDVFAVYGPGKEIIHPIAKVSMGFQPGPYKGKIRVADLFGTDAAEAIALEGAGKIEANDLVVVPGKIK